MALVHDRSAGYGNETIWAQGDANNKYAVLGGYHRPDFTNCELGDVERLVWTVLDSLLSHVVARSELIMTMHVRQLVLEIASLRSTSLRR